MPRKVLDNFSMEFHGQELNSPTQSNDTVFPSSQGRRIGLHKLSGDRSCDRYNAICQKLALLPLHFDFLDVGQNTRLEYGGTHIFDTNYVKHGQQGAFDGTSN